MTATGWQPESYLAFADHRLRPALDLLARVPLAAPARVVDLGCGTGTLTRHARARWPEARVTGIDASDAMLARARAEPDGAGITWQAADMATWRPASEAERPDLILSNAALHWLGDHDAVFARLLNALTPGGVLAVQMPRNFDRPSHALVKTVAARAPFADACADLVAAPPPVDPPEAYARRLLAAGMAWFDLWETDYQQILPGGPETIADFTRSTTLLPYLERLGGDGPRAAAFLMAYREEVARAYDALPDGRTLFAFRRLFLIAARPG